MSLENVDFNSATIIDVRTPGEFAMGNVTGSTNIPLDQVPSRVDEFKQIEGDIILCCASGGRSGQATMFLQQNGMNNVHNGGGWQMVSMQVK